MAIFRLGSWNLPEFGISEAIQRTFAPQRAFASSGGSNLYGAQPKAQTPPPPPQRQWSDATDQAKLRAWEQSQLTGGNTGGVTTTTSGGNAGGGQPTQPSSGQQDYSGFEQQAPQQPQIDFDALIAPAIQGLEAAIAPLQQGYADTQTGIQSSLATQKAANQANITGQENILSQARTSQTGQAENAINEARRQYAEIQQGLQSRYGGTTGTGAFAGELAGRQTQQNIGRIRVGLSSAMQQIDDKLVQVQEVGRIALQDLEDKAADQIRQAKNNLDLQLADIRRQKGEIQARKAELATNAIQMYQNTVNNVNAQNASFKQNLYLQQQAAEQNLKLAQQQASQIASSFQGADYGAGKQTTPVGNANYQVTPSSVTGGGELDILRRRYAELPGIGINPVIGQATWGGF